MRAQPKPTPRYKQQNGILAHKIMAQVLPENQQKPGCKFSSHGAIWQDVMKYFDCFVVNSNGHR